MAPRPLNIIYTDYPQVVPKGVSFDVTVSLWDQALETLAAPDVGLPEDHSRQCILSLIGEGELDGDLIATMNAETGQAVFAGLSVLLPAFDYQIEATCGDWNLKGPEFAVHDWPETATVRKQTIGLRYTGSLYYAVETINALNHVIVEGQDDVSVIDIESGENPADKYLDLSNYDSLADPTCYKGITCSL